jgi:hypothetical protein
MLFKDMGEKRLEQKGKGHSERKAYIPVKLILRYRITSLSGICVFTSFI